MTDIDKIENILETAFLYGKNNVSDFLWYSRYKKELMKDIQESIKRK